MSEWRVERMMPDRDLDEVLDVEAISFSNPWTRQMFVWEIENSDVSYVYVLRVAENDVERVAAFCSFWLVYDELHINNLAVRPEYRGHGMAKALLDAVLQEGVRLGATRATLEVRESNVAARRLYEGRGFQVTATRRKYYSKPAEDALILWRSPLSEAPYEPSTA